MKNIFNKDKQVEATQEDEKPYETVQTVPESGNETKQPSTQNFSTSNAVEQAKQKVKQAKEEQKIFGKFFQLDIGEEAIVTIDPNRIDTFKTKTKSGDLSDQFRFYLIDIRAQDRTKTFDCYANTADQILNKMDEMDGNGNPKHTMKIKCVANQTGGRKYQIEDAN